MIFHASIPLHMLCLLLVTPLYLFTQETLGQLLKACSVLRVYRELPGLTTSNAAQEFAHSPVDALITLDWNNLSVNTFTDRHPPPHFLSQMYPPVESGVYSPQKIYYVIL